jgi:hypothetical protein
VRKNKFSENDDINTLLSLSQAIAKKLYIWYIILAIFK